MIGIDTLLSAIDAYKRVAEIERDSTLSSRMFDDGKRIGRLREHRADITVGRFHAAMEWLRDRWPPDEPMPEALRPWAEQSAAAGREDET